MKNKRITLAIIAISILVVSGTAYLLKASAESGYIFETVKVEKGSVNNTTTATGTLEEKNMVILGTQVSGVIEKLYVDFNSRVEKGQLLAELEKSTPYRIEHWNKILFRGAKFKENKNTGGYQASNMQLRTL